MATSSSIREYFFTFNAPFLQCPDDVDEGLGVEDRFWGCRIGMCMSGKVRSGRIGVLQEFDRNMRADILEYSQQGGEVDPWWHPDLWPRPARKVCVQVAALWTEVVQIDDHLLDQSCASSQLIQEPLGSLHE